MADIAAVFGGWTPAVMDPMGVAELIGWHTRALDRLQATKG
jgi:hypothetical protein